MGLNRALSEGPVADHIAKLRQTILGGQDAPKLTRYNGCLRRRVD